MRLNGASVVATGQSVEDQYPDVPEAFLARVEQYFGVSGVKYVEADNVHDIACIPTAKVILLGKKWKASRSASKQSKIVHEFLHLRNLPHSVEMRRRGYYSRPERDRLSPAVLRDILRGTRQFQPERFGLREPRRTQ